MTYRRLTNDELTELETAFIRFLALNGIPAEEWVKIKTADFQKTEALIGSFSDVVFHDTLTKLEYLQFNSQKEIRIFHCQPEKIILRGLLLIGETNIDFREADEPQVMMARIQQSNAKLSMYVTEKNYGKEREQELFEMMESGCLISDGLLFNLLSDLEKGG
jgi:cag pathogenicity island protein 24